MREKRQVGRRGWNKKQQGIQPLHIFLRVIPVFLKFRHVGLDEMHHAANGLALGAPVVPKINPG